MNFCDFHIISWYSDLLPYICTMYTYMCVCVCPIEPDLCPQMSFSVNLSNWAHEASHPCKTPSFPIPADISCQKFLRSCWNFSLNSLCLCWDFIWFELANDLYMLSPLVWVLISNYSLFYLAYSINFQEQAFPWGRTYIVFTVPLVVQILKLDTWPRTFNFSFRNRKVFWSQFFTCLVSEAQFDTHLVNRQLLFPTFKKTTTMT